MTACKAITLPGHVIEIKELAIACGLDVAHEFVDDKIRLRVSGPSEAFEAEVWALSKFPAMNRVCIEQMPKGYCGPPNRNCYASFSWVKPHDVRIDFGRGIEICTYAADEFYEDVKTYWGMVDAIASSGLAPSAHLKDGKRMSKAGRSGRSEWRSAKYPSGKVLYTIKKHRSNEWDTWRRERDQAIDAGVVRTAMRRVILGHSVWMGTREQLIGEGVCQDAHFPAAPKRMLRGRNGEDTSNNDWSCWWSMEYLRRGFWEFRRNNDPTEGVTIEQMQEPWSNQDLINAVDTHFGYLRYKAADCKLTSQGWKTH